MTINYKSWEQQMHDKYSEMYEYYHGNSYTNTMYSSGPSFSSQYEAQEWVNYCNGRANGTIKCPYCGK